MLCLPATSQKLVKFSMEDVMRIAKEQSPDAMLARNKFRASYWQYRSFRANYLPSVVFDGTLPNFDRSITFDDNTQSIIEKNSVTNFGKLSLNQNIGLTGGNVALNTSLQQINKLGASSSTKYLSTPVSITYNQPLFAYNSMKWERKIQPLAYDEAKKNYVDAIEQMTLKAISRFFDMAQAQLNLRIAQINFNNSDTLFKIAQGRYNIGTIAQNDLLQMQLSYFNSKIALTQADVNLQLQKARLGSFLGYNEKMDFELALPDKIPTLQVEYVNVLDLANKNNPDVIAWKRRQIEADRDVAQAKGSRKTINLYASYGKNHLETSAVDLAYKSPFNDKQQVQLGISVPLMDWGRGRGRVKMAQSNQELINVQIKQEQTDFEQNIFLQVMQFNLQNEQVMIAAKTDTIGQFRYDVTKQRFLIGKIDVLNLNDALKEKDSAKRQYIGALRDYWTYFYTLRQLTLFDFVNQKPLLEDFDKLIQ